MIRCKLNELARNDSKLQMYSQKNFVITQTKQETEFIKTVAYRLAENFLEPLPLLSKEKNYSAHIGGLAEILDWAKEFYDQYL